MQTLNAVLTPRGQLKAELTPRATLTGSLRAGSWVKDYDGIYEVTPSQVAQTLNTAGFRMAQNVIIKPIPSNYGLISWNGVIMTVS